jgi:hypothetical protein
VRWDGFAFTGSTLFEVKTRGLESRYFADAPLVPEGQAGSEDEALSLQSHQSVHSGSHVVGEGMAFKEDNFLTSANLCRWVIDYNDISIGKQARADLGSDCSLVNGRYLTIYVWVWCWFAFAGGAGLIRHSVRRPVERGRGGCQAVHQAAAR